MFLTHSEIRSSISARGLLACSESRSGLWHAGRTLLAFSIFCTHELSLLCHSSTSGTLPSTSYYFERKPVVLYAAGVEERGFFLSMQMKQFVQVHSPQVSEDETSIAQPNDCCHISLQTLKVARFRASSIAFVKIQCFIHHHLSRTISPRDGPVLFGCLHPMRYHK